MKHWWKCNNYICVQSWGGFVESSKSISTFIGQALYLSSHPLIRYYLFIFSIKYFIIFFFFYRFIHLRSTSTFPQLVARVAIWGCDQSNVLFNMSNHAFKRKEKVLLKPHPMNTLGIRAPYTFHTVGLIMNIQWGLHSNEKHASWWFHINRNVYSWMLSHWVVNQPGIIAWSDVTL